MSRSTLFGVKENFDFEEVKRYQNSWGSIPVVFNYYKEFKGFGDYMGSRFEVSEPFFKKLDARFVDPEAPLSEKAVIAFISYPVAVHRTAFRPLAFGLKKIASEYNDRFKDRVNHLGEIANDILNLDEQYDFVILKGTSVDDNYEFYNDETGNPIQNLNNIPDKKTREAFDLVYSAEGKIVTLKLPAVYFEWSKEGRSANDQPQ